MYVYMTHSICKDMYKQSTSDPNLSFEYASTSDCYMYVTLNFNFKLMEFI